MGYWVNMTENGVSSFSQVTRKAGELRLGDRQDFWAFQSEVLGAYVDQPQLTGSRSYKVNLSITWYEQTLTASPASSWPWCGCSPTRPPRTGAR